MENYLEMNFNLHFINQIIIGLLFTLIFIGGSIFLIQHTNFVNQEKSLFPILIYTNTLSEANDVLDAVINHHIYSGFQLTYPELLEKLIFDRYDLNDFIDISNEITLPFLLELNLNPVHSIELNDFINEIKNVFPNYIIHYNEQIWKEIDEQVNKLTIILWIMQFTILLSYLFTQFSYRLSTILKNKEIINAILSSGISPKKLSKKRFYTNFNFLLLIFIFCIGVNYLASYIFIFNHFAFSIEFLNFKLLAIFYVINLTLVVSQKPIFPKKKYE